MMVASTVAVGRRVLMMCSWVHCLVSGTKQYTLYTQVRFVTRNKCVSSILFGMVAMHASVMRHIWRPTGHRAFDEDTRFQGLPVASFAPDYTLIRQEVAAQLVSAFILSRLDYCNSVLAGLPRCTTEPLQCVLNAAARLVLNLRPRDHVTPVLQQLHWLPIEYGISYKLCLVMHLVHSKRAPQHLSNSVQTVARSSSRPGLRSSDTAVYAKPRCRTKFGERGFSHAGPTAWNSLPHHLYQISDTGLFKRRLKTELFRRAYVASS